MDRNPSIRPVLDESCVAPHSRGGGRDCRSRCAASRRLTVLYTVAGLVSALVTPLRAETLVRVSVKPILDAQGARASGPYASDAGIEASISEANQTLANVGVSWRLDLVEIVEMPNAAEWFDMSCDSKGVLEQQAETDPNRFRWRSDAVNVYITPLADCGGVCSFPTEYEDIIVMNASGPDRSGAHGAIWVHELGHYFGLFHTFQSLDESPSDRNVCRGAGGLHQDGSLRPCPDSCPHENNLMSYSFMRQSDPTRAVFTSCQLDLITENMNTHRIHVLVGGPPECDYDWTGTPYEGNCPPDWNGTSDGCDCGCQFVDQDCPEAPIGDECCGGGVPALLPLMLMGWSTIPPRARRSGAVVHY